MTSRSAHRVAAHPRCDSPPALAASGPSRQQRTFPGRPSELARLRRWLVGLLPDTPARDDVVTIAVELCTNAIQHTASGQGGAGLPSRLGKSVILNCLPSASTNCSCMYWAIVLRAGSFTDPNCESGPL